MTNHIHFTELPLGLGMALTQNTKAMQKFSAMDEKKQREIISYTKNIQSKEQMREFVNRIGEDEFEGFYS